MRHGAEGPVVDVAGDHQHQRKRRRDHPIVVLAAGIQQRHRRARILRKPSRHGAAAGAAAHHHEIECVRHAHPPGFCVLADLYGRALGAKLRFCGLYGKSGSIGRFWRLSQRLFAFVFAVIKSSKAAIAPFQSRGTLIHTPRTRWLCPGCLLRKPPDGIDRRRTSVGRVHFGSGFLEGLQRFNAGWSSPVARQAHNLKVIGSNPIPATKLIENPSNLN